MGVEAGRDDDQLGREAASRGRIAVSNASRNLLAAVARAQRRVDDIVVLAALATARRCPDRAASRGSSSTSRSDRTRRSPACRCRGGRRNRPRRRGRGRGCFCAWRAAMAALLKRQKPIGRTVSAWWPGGRMRAEGVVDAFLPSPRRPPASAPPTARSAASKVPGDIEVSASSRTMPCFGVASRISLDVVHGMAERDRLERRRSAPARGRASGSSRPPAPVRRRAGGRAAPDGRPA